MLASSQNIAPKPAALPPAVPPAMPASSAGGPSFAQFLTDQTSPPPPQPERSPEPGQADEAESSQAAAAAAPRRANAQAAKPAAQNRAAEATPKAAATDQTEARPDTDAVAAADDDDTAATPELKEFTQLLGLQSGQPDAAAARPDSPRGRATSAAAADDATQSRSALRAATSDKDRAADQADAAARKLTGLRADKAAARATAEPVQVSSQPAGSDQPAATATPATPAAPSFAAVLAQALPTPTALPGKAADATYANVQAPLHGAAFAPELGARVSLMAVDGVQHAELQLNPADMGPVTVQIVVDGSQAQVSFHAAQAETRQALEQSLPDLAAALQGQGLTLSGGGVFQQAQRDADHAEDGSDAGAAGGSSRGGNDRTGSSAHVAAAPARRSVGLLDTFA